MSTGAELRILCATGEEPRLGVAHSLAEAFEFVEWAAETEVLTLLLTDLSCELTIRDYLYRALIFFDVIMYFNYKFRYFK